jgi:hypothetical protein
LLIVAPSRLLIAAALTLRAKPARDKAITEESLKRSLLLYINKSNECVENICYLT